GRDLPLPTRTGEGGDVDLSLARLVRRVREPSAIRREPAPFVTKGSLEHRTRRSALLERNGPDLRDSAAGLLKNDQLAVGKSRPRVGAIRRVGGQTPPRAAAVGGTDVQVVRARLARVENDALAVRRPDRAAVVLAERETCQAVAR